MFKIGDKVLFKVPTSLETSFDRYDSHENGVWRGVYYSQYMEEYIGQIGEVTELANHPHHVETVYNVKFQDNDNWNIPESFLVSSQEKKEQPTLYLIRGIPGSGKSTLAQSLLDAGVVAVVYEADQYFVDGEGVYKFDNRSLGEAHGFCQRQAANDLTLGLSVAVSNTSTTEKEVAVYQQMAEELGAKFVSLVVESRHDGKNQHGVPEEKLEQMRNRFSVKL